MQLKKIYVRSNELTQLAQGRDGMVQLMGSAHPFPGSIQFEIVAPSLGTATAEENQMELPIKNAQATEEPANLN